MGFFSTIISLYQIAKNFDKTIATLQSNMLERETRLRREIETVKHVLQERTEVNLDHCIKERSHVVVIGRYKHNDFVQIFDVRDSTINSVVEMLKAQENFAHVNRVDSAPLYSRIIKKELDL